MKFDIYRTSGLGKPCDGSQYYEGEITLSDDIYSSEMQVAYWYIEVNTLDELLDLCKNNGGQIIIDTKDQLPSIEIYDDYRE